MRPLNRYLRQWGTTLAAALALSACANSRTAEPPRLLQHAKLEAPSAQEWNVYWVELVSIELNADEISRAGGSPEAEYVARFTLPAATHSYDAAGRDGMFQNYSEAQLEFDGTWAEAGSPPWLISDQSLLGNIGLGVSLRSQAWSDASMVGSCDFPIQVPDDGVTVTFGSADCRPRAFAPRGGPFGRVLTQTINSATFRITRVPFAARYLATLDRVRLSDYTTTIIENGEFSDRKSWDDRPASPPDPKAWVWVNPEGSEQGTWLEGATTANTWDAWPQVPLIIGPPEALTGPIYTQVVDCDHDGLERTCESYDLMFECWFNLEPIDLIVGRAYVSRAFCAEFDDAAADARLLNLERLEIAITPLDAPSAD